MKKSEPNDEPSRPPLLHAAESTGALPIDALRDDFLREHCVRPVIITAPTGTGKSTQVPRWLLQTESEGAPILVVQPRRVAARAVAARIADLDGVQLGKEVGYRVRDDDRSGKNTRLLVVTPGIVLTRPELLDGAGYVILDELHERRLDTDLIFALLAQKKRPFAAMSATMDGDAVAKAVGGVHLSVGARTFAVTTSYLETSGELPSARGLEKRVQQGLSQLQEAEGDVLVFLPGKGEIGRVADALSSEPFEVVQLHGGLTLEQQARALSSSKRRRVILTTNVAETSLTILGVRAVIDSGLVRRTTYHYGRTYLTLATIALDSAAQRAGRAGRTAPGTCIRLWGNQAKLREATPPEIHREDLTPLVMTCAALELDPKSLPFLDPPKDYAVEDATARLSELGVLARGTTPARLTEIGRQLFGLPLDPWLSRVLIEARSTGCLQDAIDLVALLEQPAARSIAALVPDEELSHPFCDAEALVFAARSLSPGNLRPSEKNSLREARSTAKRLRRAFSLREVPSQHAPIDREALLRTMLRADPICAHVARQRKRRLVFSNGGTEMELGRETRAARLRDVAAPTEKLDAVVVLETHGVSSGADHHLIITLASPVPLSWLAELGLDSQRVKRAQRAKSGPQKGKLVVEVERTYAGRVIETREQEPEGVLARDAIVELFNRGALFPQAKKEALRRTARRSLAASLSGKPDFPHFQGCNPPPAVDDWLSDHLQELGVESGDDLQLLSPDDFLPPDVPAELAPQLDERFPLEVDIGDCLYAVDYDIEKKQAMLSIVRGSRKKPPPAGYLPRFEGLRVFVEAGGSFHRIRR